MIITLQKRKKNINNKNYITISARYYPVFQFIQIEYNTIHQDRD